MRILVVNAGSSSLKLRVIDDALEPGGTLVGSRDLKGPEEIASALPALGGVDAVGHRIVHGGTEFSAAVRIEGDVVERLRGLADLAPLHQPRSLAALEAVAAVIPATPAIACFDTAFHAGLPAAASTYPLPGEWRARWGLRRFGFHGLSHVYVARRAAAILARPLDDLRIVTCHLGAGASLAAVQNGGSVDTTMGFTPLEGLVMATRSGSVDPGLLLWLQDHGIDRAELGEALELRSGLAGLAGSADMREVLAAESQGNPEATLAIAVYLHRLRGLIAAMAAAMNGLDVLVFTGGVGERAVSIRGRTADGLAFLGVAVDAARNEASAGDREIGVLGAAVATLVIESREDLEIARQVRELLGSSRLGHDASVIRSR
jgi:acetate kinase